MFYIDGFMQKALYPRKACDNFVASVQLVVKF